MTEHFHFLRSLYFFKNLGDNDVDYIAQHCHVENVPADTILFYEQSPADKFYIVLEGSIEIWKNHGRPHATRLAIEGRGHVFGEMALVDDLPRSATVITHQNSRFLFLYHHDFEAIMQERTSVTLAILRSLASMVRSSNEEFIRNLAEQNSHLAQAYTELKAAQEQVLQSERLSNLGKFASFILHDLRNPLAAIKGYAEMIVLESDDTNSLGDHAKKIVQEADYLNRFANEILDYSRGDIRLQYALTHPQHMLQKIESYIKDAVQRKNITLEIKSTCQQAMIVDEDRIIRALTNVADNARKACAKGGCISINAEQDQDMVVLTIQDNGEGMSPEVQAKIFDPFFSSSRQGGTGLGMLVVKNVVEAHRGTIQIESQEQVGTRVLIRIPLKPE
jgi:signal transduction histidine kinase